MLPGRFKTLRVCSSGRWILNKHVFPQSSSNDFTALKQNTMPFIIIPKSLALCSINDRRIQVALAKVDYLTIALPLRTSGIASPRPEDSLLEAATAYL